VASLPPWSGTEPPSLLEHEPCPLGMGMHLRRGSRMFARWRSAVFSLIVSV
jgi:hypothetical protein